MRITLGLMRDGKAIAEKSSLATFWSSWMELAWLIQGSGSCICWDGLSVTLAGRWRSSYSLSMDAFLRFAEPKACQMFKRRVHVQRTMSKHVATWLFHICLVHVYFGRNFRTGRGAANSIESYRFPQVECGIRSSFVVSRLVIDSYRKYLLTNSI